GVSFDTPPPVPEPPPAPVAKAAPKGAPAPVETFSDSGTIEIDLTDALADPPVPAPLTSPAPRSLDQVFRGLRDESNRQSAEEAAAEQYRLALTYHEMGMTEDAMKALEGATRSPRQRFDAASMLGRLYLERKDMEHAIEWLERAAEAPAPTADAGRSLLYDLAQTLEVVGESSRALAVFVELESESGGYRDVSGHIDRLSKVQARG
ncbi:MAG: tetratricopeptide repeat protein, partial [Acidobacteriota bacterium]|nr:tetratricopeptide repeat protein [Acidobacteriota bacterium]